MAKFNIFEDIVERTGGDIYLGVVGPVRTGKSTFIKKFMELLVLPNIKDLNVLERTRDELPQGSGGKNIMTTEPKFIPDEAIEITIKDKINFRVRFVDCVGYTVREAVGYYGEEGPRMVSTPWFDYDIPFEEAAELGTKKVISEHSTIGLLITSDGTITEISRQGYLEAEERVVEELKEIGKPFVIILNSTRPAAGETISFKEELSKRYNVPVIPINCLNLSENDISAILEEVLYEFPVREIAIKLPSWVDVLDHDHWLRKDINEGIRINMVHINRLRDLDILVNNIKELDFIENIEVKTINLGTGRASIEINIPKILYEQILSEICGEEITDEADLLKTLKEYASAKKEYDKIAGAIEQVEEVGYGIVPPQLEEMILDKPEIIRQGGRFGVRLRASAPSLHIIRVDIRSEFTPIVGSERQSEDLVNYLIADYEDNPEKLWEADIFGKPLYDVVQDGIISKLSNMPPNAQEKLQLTLEKITNEGSGGLIAIIL